MKPRKYGVSDALQCRPTHWCASWVEALCLRVSLNQAASTFRYFIVPGPDLKSLNRKV